MVANKKDFSTKLFLAITGKTEPEWRSKISELKKLGIDTATLFFEHYKKPQRDKIYKALENSCIKNIPLVHIRNDMSADELKYLCDKYDNPYLTIHEDSFHILKKWQGFYKHLYLETNYDDKLASNVNVGQIGGFCVDLSHFKSVEEQWSKEFEYTIKKRKKDIFVCNHINGYSYELNKDMHTVTSLDQFEYLKTLPRFVFGDVIAIEVDHSIKEQIKFKEHLTKLLGDMSW